MTALLTRTTFNEVIFKLMASLVIGAMVGFILSYMISTHHFELSTSAEGRRMLTDELYLPMMYLWGSRGVCVGVLYVMLKAIKHIALAISLSCAIAIACLLSGAVIYEATDADSISAATAYIFIVSPITLVVFWGEKVMNRFKRTTV